MNCNLVRIFRIKDLPFRRWCGVHFFSEISSLFFGVTSISSSFVDFLKFRIPFPMPSPIWGSFPAPKMIRMMTRMTINSGIPIPNILSSFRIMILDFGSLYQKHVYFRLLFTTAKQSAHYLIFNPMHYALCAMLLSDWRKCMGVEPTADIFCPPLDLKSRRPTRTCPLPFLD